MTADEFEREYAGRSNISVAELRRQGRVVRRCRCGADGCQGWQSVNVTEAFYAEDAWRRGTGPKPDWID